MVWSEVKNKVSKGGCQRRRLKETRLNKYISTNEDSSTPPKLTGGDNKVLKNVKLKDKINISS
jgi:hypothetical protein